MIVFGGSLCTTGGAAQDGLGGRRAEPGVLPEGKQIAERYHIRVQDALTVTMAMFGRLGLETNLEKTKALVCTPGYI